jgi:glyoxylase-like metal-dependent hydrolase (beta-lactamase superfamily II)
MTTGRGLSYQVVPVTAFEQNCSVIWCENTKKAAVVDPGGDLDRVLAVIDQKGLTLDKILLTHCHIDHAGATADLKEAIAVDIVGPQKEEQFWIDMLPQQSMMFGFPAAKQFTPDRWLEQGDTVELGDQLLEVRHCPGHTPGHVVFIHHPSRLAIVGDVLFNGSIGRTDFPKGDMQTLVDSIRRELWSLDDDYEFIAGHGPNSTIGYEKRTNPFVASKNG